jgi:hypothetical protein
VQVVGASHAVKCGELRREFVHVVESGMDVAAFTAVADDPGLLLRGGRSCLCGAYAFLGSR